MSLAVVLIVKIADFSDFWDMKMLSQVSKAMHSGCMLSGKRIGRTNQKHYFDSMIETHASAENPWLIKALIEGNIDYIRAAMFAGAVYSSVWLAEVLIQTGLEPLTLEVGLRPDYIPRTVRIIDHKFDSTVSKPYENEISIEGKLTYVGIKCDRIDIVHRYLRTGENKLPIDATGTTSLGRTSIINLLAFAKDKNGKVWKWLQNQKIAM
jgi:hypothetical protein